MNKKVFMKGYKGFGKGLVCKGKQYAENTVFEEDKAELCKSSMHFCKNPLDVLDFYPLINRNGDMNEFATVEALDEVQSNDDKKFCTKKLKIGAKLKLADFVKASVEFVIEKCNRETEKSSGNYTQMASSGNSAQMASSGDFAKMASSGDFAKMASSGDSAKMASSGDYTQMASSGNYTQMASSGNSAQMASSGDYTQMASSGDFAKMASSGDSAKMASSGDFAKMASSGDYSVVMCAGRNGMAKAKKGSWITLAEWVYDENKGRYIPKSVVTKQVDGEVIKEDVFYKLVDGEFTEV
mgnify:CR=1 FL=1